MTCCAHHQPSHAPPHPRQPDHPAGQHAGREQHVLGNHLAKRAPQDGTVFGAVNSALVFDTLFAGRVEGAVQRPRHDHDRQRGVFGGGADCWHASGVKTLEDVRQKGLIIGATRAPATLISCRLR